MLGAAEQQCYNAPDWYWWIFQETQAIVTDLTDKSLARLPLLHLDSSQF